MLKVDQVVGQESLFYGSSSRSRPCTWRADWLRRSGFRLRSSGVRLYIDMQPNLPIAPPLAAAQYPNQFATMAIPVAYDPDYVGAPVFAPVAPSVPSAANQRQPLLGNQPIRSYQSDAENV